MKRVLIVDDDPIYIETAHALLGSVLSAQVASAPCAMTAKALLADDDPFELVLLDLNMPDCDGVELLDHLCQANFRAPIIIVSSADSSLRSAAYELGRAKGLNVIAALDKPLTLEKLVRALAHV